MFFQYHYVSNFPKLLDMYDMQNYLLCTNLLVYDEELLKKYNEIWDKISNLLKKGLIVN